MPKKEKTLHILTEAGSVLVLAPALYYIGTQTTNPTHKAILYTSSALMFLIDGYLLLKADEWNKK